MGHWTADGPDFITTLELDDTVVFATGIGTVKGNGTFTGPGIAGGGGAFTVTGTDSSGAIRLAFTSVGHATAYFTGVMVADTEIVGHLDSSGFNHLPHRFSRNPVVGSITVAPQSDSTLPGRTVQFRASAFDLLGRPIPQPSVSWGTSDSTRATISTSGLLNAVTPGSVTVSASSNGVVGQTPFKVLSLVASVIVNPPEMTLVVPTTVGLSATLLDSTGSEITGRAVSWSSLNAAVAQVTPGDSVKGQSTGSANVRATVTLDGKTGITHVTVRTTQITQLAGGGTHTCGIDADSTVVCWGDGRVGQLGGGLRTIVAAPMFVVGARRFRAIVAGHVHTCGLAVDSAAYCWGGDVFGQQGDGNDTPDTVPVPAVGGLKFVALTSGYEHTCGLVAGGGAYCWGRNLRGELGTGSTSQPPNASPLPVSGGLSFTMLAAGNEHTCGIASDSTAYCWGGNDFGALGDSTTISHSAPAAVAGGGKFTAIAAGSFHTCAITSLGEAYCWGNNIDANLGDSSSNLYRTVPGPVRSGGVLFTAMAAGYNHTCALAISGAIYCWGSSDNGQSGPNAGSGAPMVPVGLTGTAITAGGWHTCAVTAGGAYCWGFAQLGQLGSGTAPVQSATPLRVSGQP
jgi:alpha-tubulin suppressor-like RCC1 family protein